jgi:succinate-acetate transporter protein
MSPIRENAEDLRDSVEALLENQAAYYKLWTFKVGMKSLTLLIRLTLFTLFGLMALLFASMAAALAIGNALGSMTQGFLVTGGFYALMLIAVYVLREQINRSILRRFSDIFFADGP